MSDLQPRQQSILRAIVVEYVSTAEPIGSEALTTKYELGVKSATVRNEMAEMSDLGYLEQPHTSAGRIPSDLGYRFFVDRLIVRSELEQSTKQRLAQIPDSGDALQATLRDTARALSRLTRLLTVATTMRDDGVSVRHALLSALGPAQALLVLILSNGHVENRMLEVPSGVTLEDIGKTNEELALGLVTKPLRSLVRSRAPIRGSVESDRLMATVWTHVRAIARELTRGVMVTEGEEFMFAQPEFFRDAAALREILDEITNGDVLYEAVAPADSAQVVTIGREHRNEKMRPLSIVRRSFFVGDTEAGIIAIIGPTRMAYEASIPLVSFTAQALSQSLTRFYG